MAVSAQYSYFCTVQSFGGYPDRIPQDKIPQDKIPTDKIPQDRIPQDRIPQPEMWTKSHNMKNWQGRWIETALVNWLHWHTLLCWRGRARWIFQPDIRYWDVPTCSASPRSGWSQPAAGAATIPTRTVERRWSECQWGTSGEQPVWGVEQPILSSGWLQSSVNAREPESRDADRSGPDWSATSEANPTPLCQSAESLPRALSGSRRWPQDNR